jgi:RNA polymerase sigma factor (sigma-70 family)
VVFVVGINTMPKQNTSRANHDQDQDLVRLYLQDLGKHPLLTKDDEVRLAQIIEAGRDAATRLASKDKLTPAERRRLRQAVTAGDDATQQFVNANLRLVVSIAKKYQAADLPLLDLVQEGNLGLIHAVEKFDWRKGFKFSTYATWWIRQAIGRAIDNTSRTIRLPIHAGDQLRRLRKVRTELESEMGRMPSQAELAAALDVTEEEVAEILRFGTDPVSLDTPVGDDGDSNLADIVADRGAPSPFDVVANEMLSGEIDKLMAPLDERERQILRLRYGLDRGEPRTLDDVGVEMQLTRERVRQIEKAALVKLRNPDISAGAKELLAS